MIFAPAELTKWFVANNQIYSLLIGDAVETRLVYDENGELAGTFTIIPPTPKSTTEASTLLNIAKLLATSWCMKDDNLPETRSNKLKTVPQVPEEAYFERGRSPYLKNSDRRCDEEESSDLNLFSGY